MAAGRNTGPDDSRGTDDGVASNSWKAVAAALADARRLDLYARIVTAANAGAPLQASGLDRQETKSLAALEKAGLVSVAQEGTLSAEAAVFADLLAAGRKPAVSSPLRLLAPGRAGSLPGRRTDRLELLHHLAGEVFSRHGKLAVRAGGAGAGGGLTGVGDPADLGNPADPADPAASRAQLTEAEVTARLADFSDDPAMVRRAMVDEGIVRRSPDGSRYWLAKPRPADGMEFA